MGKVKDVNISPRDKSHYIFARGVYLVRCKDYLRDVIAGRDDLPAENRYILVRVLLSQLVFLLWS
jgi:hypothetical protein